MKTQLSLLLLTTVLALSTSMVRADSLADFTTFFNNCAKNLVKGDPTILDDGNPAAVDKESLTSLLQCFRTKYSNGDDAAVTDNLSTLISNSNAFINQAVKDIKNVNPTTSGSGADPASCLASVVTHQLYATDWEATFAKPDGLQADINACYKATQLTTDELTKAIKGLDSGLKDQNTQFMKDLTTLYNLLSQAS